MKKYLFLILAAALAASLLLSSCAAVTSTKPSGSQSYSSTINSSQSTSTIVNSSQSTSSESALMTMPKTMQNVLEMPDQKLVDKLAGLDLCLADNLLFTDSKDISSEILFTFFEYIIDGGSGDYPKDYYKKWYDKNEKVMVPVSDIKAILNKYFNGINFDPTKINGYNAKTDKIYASWGFGGARFPKLAKKEIVSYNTLRVTIIYYDDTCKNVWYTKAYTIRYDDTGYKYLSIVKV